MRHKQHSHSFNRRGGPRKALVKGLMISLVEHGRIKTTLTKAKELKRHIERAVTLGKKDNVNSRRILVARLGSETAAQTLVKEISPRFKTRAGGYTRILKLNARAGDMAPMALIEFVDYKLPETAKDGDTKVKAVTKEEKAHKRQIAKAHLAHKKSVRRMQTASRRASRR